MTDTPTDSMPIRPADGYNAALAARTLAFLDAHPEAHDQGSWLSCFAGHALRQAGHSLVIHSHTGMVLLDGAPVSVKYEAQALLGLASPEADAMFADFMSLADLHAGHAALLAGDAGALYQVNYEADVRTHEAFLAAAALDDTREVQP